MINNAELEKRALLYANSRGRTILPARLGTGTDGTVWQTNLPSAVKVSARSQSHANERDCYLRLRGIRMLCGFRVPQLIDYDDDLLVVEIDIIEGPCILDFGKAYIDRKPPFDSE